MIYEMRYVIMMISERNHIMRGRTSRKDRWSIVFETRILERESASFCTLKRLGERQRASNVWRRFMLESGNVWTREWERERQHMSEQCHWIKCIETFWHNRTSQDNTRQDSNEKNRRTSTILGERRFFQTTERERESYIVRHLQMFSRKFLLLQRASAATPWRCRLQYTCTNTYINNIVEE